MDQIWGNDADRRGVALSQLILGAGKEHTKSRRAEAGFIRSSGLVDG